jgi:Fe-S cluster biogenesis protein NfuA
MTTSASPADLQHRVDAAIDEHIARFLDSHGGAVASATVTPDGDVTLRFAGACQACPAVAATFYSKVAPIVRAVSGVRSVHAPNVNVSEAAVTRILALSAPPRRTPER